MKDLAQVAAGLAGLDHRVLMVTDAQLRELRRQREETQASHDRFLALFVAPPTT